MSASGAVTCRRDVQDGTSVDFIERLQSDLADIEKENDGCDAKVASGGGRMRVTMDRYEVRFDEYRVRYVIAPHRHLISPALLRTEPRAHHIRISLIVQLFGWTSKAMQYHRELRYPAAGSGPPHT